MPGIDYTMDAVIADVKRNGAIPTSQSLFDESDFVKVLSDEMKTVLVPLLMSVQENHFETFKDTTIVTDQDNYPTPWRAIGNKLKTVEVWDGGVRLVTLPRVELRDSAVDVAVAYARLNGFRMEGPDVVLYPTNSWAGKTLRLHYFRRPNDLVPTSEVGKITAINTGTKEVTLDNVPSEWSTSDVFDLITNNPPFKTSGEELAVSAIASPVLTFVDALPASLAVGDYVALKGQSPIPQIPYDAFPLLSARGVAIVLGTLSPQQGKQAEQQYAGLAKMYLNLISPRVDDAPKRLIARKGIWQASGARRWPS